ncbi:MAG: response regulator receiver domain/DnaJ domain- containing protein [Candidatus Magnetoglobus multicellularis str. Araruama]|uniref:Response regulator receiver domain/DnaJ domain-containing protein n=1 Tax=Candidatus Magnetoglobus multicellularis str. Araruama TaxID=890399 RepID=A0A1V1NRW7_9BACT|nr:MAG: response regulator receiver domain/DnaJ domain- containing protein [Candidatus Magnetoglobus multicellularis str. Araruama]
MIHLAKSIEQAWRQTVEQSASASDEISETGRINAEIRLDAEMGDAALEMLERVMAGDFGYEDPWERDSSGCYIKNVGDVIVTYNPLTHRLNVETQLTESLTAEATATAEACGFTIGNVAVEALGQYYDDGWGGRTKEAALSEAQKKAEEKLSQAIEELNRQQNPETFLNAENKASKTAREKAELELEKMKENARIAMRERIMFILANSEENVNHMINRAVGEAYRQTLRKVVLDSGGRVITDDNTGSIINMELELR